MTTYLLDGSVFIQAKNLHYGFDFCPAFWDWLDVQNGLGQVFSVEQVGDEILAGDDELARWARQRPGMWRKGPDEVDGIEELCMRLRLSALGDSTVEGVQSFHEGIQFWIVGEGDDQEAIRRVDNTQSCSAEFVGVDGGIEFEDQYQTRIHPEHLWSLLMAHRDVGDRLPDPAAMAWEVVVTAISAAEARSGPSLACWDGAPKPE